MLRTRQSKGWRVPFLSRRLLQERAGGFALWFTEPALGRNLCTKQEHGPLKKCSFGQIPLFCGGRTLLLRGRLQVRILPGSPKPPEKYGLFTGRCAEDCKKSRQLSGRNRLKRPISRTKPVQNSHVCAYFGGQS